MKLYYHHQVHLKLILSESGLKFRLGTLNFLPDTSNILLGFITAVVDITHDKQYSKVQVLLQLLIV